MYDHLLVYALQEVLKCSEYEAKYLMPLDYVFRIFHSWAFVHNIPMIRVENDANLMALYEQCKANAENEEIEDDDEFLVKPSSFLSQLSDAVT